MGAATGGTDRRRSGRHSHRGAGRVGHHTCRGSVLLETLRHRHIRLPGVLEDDNGRPEHAGDQRSGRKSFVLSVQLKSNQSRIINIIISIVVIITMATPHTRANGGNSNSKSRKWLWRFVRQPTTNPLMLASTLRSVFDVRQANGTTLGPLRL